MKILSASDIRFAADRLLIFLESVRPTMQSEESADYNDACEQARQATEILTDNIEDLHDHLKRAMLWANQYIAVNTKPDTF